MVDRLTWTEYLARTDTGEWLYDWQVDGDGISESSVPDEVVQALDWAHPDVPAEVVVTAWERGEGPDAEREAEFALDALIERLDDDYGDPDGPTDQTPPMKAAMLAAVRAVLAEYTVWRCEQVAEIVVRREDLPALWAALAAAKGGTT